VATTQAALTAFKAASPTGSVARGSTITYTIYGSNTGGSAAYAVTSVVTVWVVVPSLYLTVAELA